MQYLYNISKKEVRDGFHFLPADKHESFYKLALSFITEVTRHVQSTQKKEEVGYIYFWYIMFVVTCSVSNDFIQMVTISNLIPDYDSHTPNLSDLFFFDPSICHTVAFPPLWKYCAVVSIYIKFSTNSKWVRFLITYLLISVVVAIILQETLYLRIYLNSVLLLLFLI